MSRKNRPVIPMPNRNGPVKIETRELSDKSKLVWERFTGPLASAAAQMNAAIQVAQDTVARCLMEAEGLSPNEWLFDISAQKFVKRPPETKEGAK